MSIASAIVKASYDGGDRVDITVRGHRIRTDQPFDGGGSDTGPTPTELLVGSLVSCMGFYAQRFLRRNGVDPADLRLSARFTTTNQRPHRVTDIEIAVHIPPRTPERLVAPLQRVMDSCTVHNTLRTEPSITVSLSRVYPDECEAG